MKCPAVIAGFSCRGVHVGLDAVEAPPDRKQVHHHGQPNERVGADEERRGGQLLRGRQRVHRHEAALPGRRLDGERRHGQQDERGQSAISSRRISVLECEIQLVERRLALSEVHSQHQQRGHQQHEGRDTKPEGAGHRRRQGRHDRSSADGSSARCSPTRRRTARPPARTCRPLPPACPIPAPPYFRPEVPEMNVSSSRQRHRQLGVPLPPHAPGLASPRAVP